MAELLPAIELAATRVVVVNAFRDAVRNAEMDPGLALEALLEAAMVDDEDVVVGSVLRFCSEVLAASSPRSGRRPERLARVHRDGPRGHRRCRVGLGPPAARFAVRHRHLCRRQGAPALVGRSELPPGLQLDPELIWSLVVRLAEVGGDAARSSMPCNATRRRRDACMRPGPGLTARSGGEDGRVVGAGRAVRSSTRRSSTPSPGASSDPGRPC